LFGGFQQQLFYRSLVATGFLDHRIDNFIKAFELLSSVSVTK